VAIQFLLSGRTRTFVMLAICIGLYGFDELRTCECACSG
jgi:hypothetical protein